MRYEMGRENGIDLPFMRFSKSKHAEVIDIVLNWLTMALKIP